MDVISERTRKGEKIDDPQDKSYEKHALKESQGRAQQPVRERRERHVLENMRDEIDEQADDDIDADENTDKGRHDRNHDADIEKLEQPLRDAGIKRSRRPRAKSETCKRANGREKTMPQALDDEIRQYQQQNVINSAHRSILANNGSDFTRGRACMADVIILAVRGMNGRSARPILYKETTRLLRTASRRCRSLF